MKQLFSKRWNSTFYTEIHKYMHCLYAYMVKTAPKLTLDNKQHSEPQQNYHSGMVSNKLLRGGPNKFYGSNINLTLRLDSGSKCLFDCKTCRSWFCCDTRNPVFWVLDKEQHKLEHIGLIANV